MRVEEIEKLLAGYYEGTTSEAEEQMLNVYFRSTEVPAHLQRDKEMFLGFRPTEHPEVPAALEEKLIRLIDAQAGQGKHRSLHRLGQWATKQYSGIAAGLLLLIGIGYAILEYRSDSRPPKDTFSNPQEAYAVLQATLLEVSSGLNDGWEEVEEVGEDIRETKKQFIQNIQ